MIVKLLILAYPRLSPLFLGDLDTSLPEIDLSEPKIGFENVPELEA